MTTPDPRELFGLFRPPAAVPACEPLPAAGLPEPYRRLLDHPHHMTVTVEDFYGGPVNVRVLDRRHAGDTYAREILLTTADGRVVQSGVVRIRLDLCSDPVRAEIVAGTTPLGRVLIDHDVLRRIEVTGFLRLPPGPDADRWFGAGAGPCYGRVGIIHCDGQPAVELLEILAPTLPISPGPV